MMDNEGFIDAEDVLEEQWDDARDEVRTTASLGAAAPAWRRIDELNEDRLLRNLLKEVYDD
jgi:hypothetical protein